MRKVLLLLLSLMVMQIPAFSINKRMLPSQGGENDLPNIFIYKIPDSENEAAPEKTDEDENNYINENPVSSSENTEEEIMLDMSEENSDDTVLGATVLKGYAEYIEDAEAIYLKDDNNNFVVNLKVPQKIAASEGLNLTKHSSSKTINRYKNEEYKIAPNSIRAAETRGNLTFGALYGSEVDNIAMLESETGLFTKYEKSRFALSTTYKKNLNTTYNLFYDTISLAPEFKLNNYMSIKNEYKADITRNRKSGALIFSINPFGKKDTDRLRFEIGAKQTIYADNVTTKTELNFSTKLKL